MSFDLLKIWHEMGLFARGIVFALCAMAIASLGVFLERMWTLRRSRLATENFEPKARELLDRESHEELQKTAGQFPLSPAAELVEAGLDVYLQSERKPGAVSSIELTRRALERELERLSGELRSGLGVLASVGSIAPFVGLLGTVVGIIDAFSGIAEKGSGGIGSVAGGISEALIVTALGLLVAIPSVLLFNFLSTKIDGVVLELGHSRGEFLDILETGRRGPEMVRNDNLKSRQAA